MSGVQIGWCSLCEGAVFADSDRETWLTEAGKPACIKCNAKPAMRDGTPVLALPILKMQGFERERYVSHEDRREDR